MVRCTPKGRGAARQESGDLFICRIALRGESYAEELFWRAAGARKGVSGAVKRGVPSVAFLLLLFFPVLPQAAAQVGAAAVNGTVRDLQGTPQMGALVELLGANAAVVAHTFTDDHGRYLLSAVLPGQYQLRVSAAFLLPAVRSNLRLNPGMQALANLTMTAMVDVGTWFPVAAREPDEPSDDWRWTLRSNANRPLLRLVGDGSDVALSGPEAEHGTVSSEQARMTVSADEGSFGDGGVHQVFAINRSEQGGATGALRANLGEPAVDRDSASLAVNAGYERQTALGGETRTVLGFESQPEVSAPGDSGLQMMTLASSERIALGDAVMIDAGTLLSAERLVADRVTAEPFVRIVLTPEAGIALMYRYASGQALQSSDDLDELQVRPQVLSDAGGKPVAPHAAHQEIAVTRRSGPDSATIAIYQDRSSVAALLGGGNLDARSLAGLAVVDDPSAGTFRVAVDGYAARGVSFGWTRQITAGLAASFAADLGSALVRSDADLALANLQSGVRERLSPALCASLHGTLGQTGTSFRAQYRWQPGDTLDAVNAFNAAPDQAYLSFFLRQRLFSGHRLQGVSAIVEATNLLEEGYQPMLGPDGQTLFLAQVPRTMQAGLSFSF